MTEASILMTRIIVEVVLAIHCHRANLAFSFSLVCTSIENVKRIKEKTTKNNEKETNYLEPFFTLGRAFFMTAARVEFYFKERFHVTIKSFVILPN